MKNGTERRLAAVERRCNQIGMLDFEVVTCPHVLFPDEKPPCRRCDSGQGKRRICTRYVKPRVKE